MIITIFSCSTGFSVPITTCRARDIVITWVKNKMENLLWTNSSPDTIRCENYSLSHYRYGSTVRQCSPEAEELPTPPAIGRYYWVRAVAVKPVENDVSAPSFAIFFLLIAKQNKHDRHTRVWAKRIRGVPRSAQYRVKRHNRYSSLTRVNVGRLSLTSTRA